MLGTKPQDKRKDASASNSALFDAMESATDLLNAFNIRQGELVGRCAYGTTLFDMLFENQTQDTLTQIYAEIQRVAAGDPRIYISALEVFPQQNGLLLQLELTVVQTTDAQRLSVFFDQNQRVATFV
jgi:phage baseplate assembly protein W